MNRSTQLGFEQLELTAERTDKQALIARLVPIARSLAVSRGEDGVTVSDVRIAAVRGGILAAESKGRELSFLGAVMKRAGLVPTKDFRRSDVEGSHGNNHRVWRRP